MTDISLKKHKLRYYSIHTLYKSKRISSFCWRYFGELILEKDNKRRKIFSDQVFCNVCLETAKEESEDISFDLARIKTYKRTVSTGNLCKHLRDVHNLREEQFEILIENIKQEFNMDPLRHNLSTGTTATHIYPLLSRGLSPVRETLSTETAEGVPNTSVARQDSWTLARDLALWFCRSLMPFDSLSDEGMLDFFQKYNIIVTKEDMPSRDTVRRDALDHLYESMLEIIQTQFANDATRHVSVTFDLWRDQYRRLNYITFMLHYLTTDMQFQSFTLSTKMIEGKITEQKIQAMLNDVRTVYGLNNKEIHTVTDSGSNVKTANTTGDMDSHFCLGHGLHKLVTTDGIKSVPDIEVVVKKAKMIVKAIQYHLPDLQNNADEEKIQLFNLMEKAAQHVEYDEEVPIPNMDGECESPGNSDAETMKEEFVAIDGVNMKTSTPTRWHTVLEMLESLLDQSNKKQINNLLIKIKRRNLKIKQEEWNTLESCLKFLRKFREVVEVLSSQKTASLNLALVFRTEIQDVLKSLSDEDTLIMALKNKMLSKMDKRFPVTDKIVSAALLDPRFAGSKEIDDYMERKNTRRAAFLADYIKKHVKASDLVAGRQRDKTVVSETGHSSSGQALLSKLAKKYSSNVTELDSEDAEISQECLNYFATMRPEDVEFTQGDILVFWKEKEKVFPWLNALARALLAIPATSTPSEYIFSDAGIVLSAKRSRLSPTRLNKIIFVHDNYDICKEYIHIY